MQAMLPNCETGHIYCYLSKLYLKIKEYAEAANFAIEAIKYDIHDDYFAQLLKIYRLLKYSKEESWLKILKARPQYWKAHQKLAEIYRKEGNQEKEVHHL